MSEIILNWLNDEIQLSKRINNFEEDFHNGYLFGELLAKYNQQLNFNEFVNKDDKKAKIKNFQLLFDSFVSLGVSFNSNVANEVINRKQGVSKKLLYELKMHLEKTSSNAFTKLTKMTKTLSPLKKIKVSKDQYDKVDKQHFVKQLNELRPAQKSVNQEKLLKKFADFHDQQKINNLNALDRQHQQSLFEKKKFRDRERDNLKKTADFRNEWERSNVQKWGANMTVRKMQHQKDHTYKSKLENTKFQNKTMSELNAIKALDKDINEFEKKFVKKKKVDYDQQASDSQSEKNENIEDLEVQDLARKESTKLCSKLKFGKTEKESFQLSLKKKKVPQYSEQSKHQREKKRRKMIVEQNKRYQLIEISRREKYIMSTIQQTSKQQKQLEYEIWRVWQNKQIIKENKNVYEEKECDKVETKLINNNFKKDELLKTYREEHEREVKDSIQRQDKLLRDQKVKERKSIYQQCKSMVEDFIGVSEKCFLHQQQNNQTELGSDLMDHLFSEFIEGARTSQQIAELELANYIHGKGEWNIKLKQSEGISTDPVEQNAVPNIVVNNYTLGNVLRYLYENKLNSMQSPEQGQNIHSQQNKSKSEYLFSLLGLEFSGKHEVARAIKEKYGFHLIEVQNLIMNRVAQYQEIKDKVTEISHETKQLAELAYEGKNIPDRLVINLLVEELKKHPKAVLINYPITYEQSIKLTKALGDVSPSDFISKSQLENKIASFCQLVSPTQSKIIQRPIQQCGLDLALWLQISPRISFDRFLGRRWLKNGQIVHIRDPIATSVGELTVGEKSSSVIMKNHDRIIQKNSLQSFFNQFGIQAVRTTVQGIPQQQLKVEQKQAVIEQQNDNQQTQQQKGVQNKQAPTEQVNLQERQKIIDDVQKEAKKEQKPTQRQVVEKRLRKSWQSINGDCSISQLIQKVYSVFQQVIDIKDFKKDINLQEKKIKQTTIEKANQQKILEEQIKEKCCLSSGDKIQEKLQQSLESVKIEKHFTQQLCVLWNRVEESTVSSLINVFKFLSEQETQKNNYISSTKRNYILMLTREDNKFSQVKSFQMEYNKFFDENPDMVSQDYTKDELHQRVDDLEDQLFDCIEQKKEDAIEQRKNIMECGWMESQLEQFYNCARIILQAELNRFNASEKILADFYSKKYAVPQQPYEETNTEISYDTSLEMYNKETDTYPRLQKLISETLRIFNKEEEVLEDKNKKGGKAPPKKDDKKGGKKGEVEQPKQPTLQELEMKRAVNTEKAIFRYRVNIIQEFSSKKISNLILEGYNLYKDVLSYYLYTYNIQNKTVLNLSKIFRSKIQNEQKIQNEVQINYVDVIETQRIRNFEKEKPIILPAKEIKNQERFTVANILETLKFIQNQSQSLEKISTKRLTYIFNHLQTNQTGKTLLPLKWIELTFQEIQKFINGLDVQKRGFMELEKIYVPIIMSEFIVPDKKQIEQYFNELTQYGTLLDVHKEKLINTAAWFDSEQIQQQNVRTFSRTKLIKEVLFDVLKTKKEGKQQQIVDASNLMEMLNLQNKEEQSNKKTYFDCAFQKY